MRIFALLLTILFIELNGNAQEFTTSTDITTGKKFLKYHHLDAQIVIHKKSGADDNNGFIELGLYVFDKTIGLSDFMNQGGIITFDDGSHLIFTEAPSFNYLYSGKHQVFLKHRLSELELKSLQSHKISTFQIGEIKKTLNKWEAERVNAAFIKMAAEPVP